MKKRMVSLLLACVMCLCLMPVAAQAADWYAVEPFYVEYFGSSAPTTGTMEITIEGKTVEVSVFPAGTRFEAFGELSTGDSEVYMNGERDYNTSFDPSAGLPAQGVYRITLYSIYYGYEGDVWVTAEGSGTSVEPTEPTTPTEPTAFSFADVAADAYYAEPVTWAVEQGITYGTSVNTFSPDDTCTRAQIIMFLWRAAGSPEPKNSSAFTDVEADAYYAAAAAWAAENGMASGSTFSPDAPCTREMAVEFMWRHAGSPSAPTAGFTDVSSAAVNWAVEKGVTYGTSLTTFSPDDTCTRAQIVTFLYRAFAE